VRQFLALKENVGEPRESSPTSKVFKIDKIFWC
jgi:hypothetical protein